MFPLPISFSFKTKKAFSTAEVLLAMFVLSVGLITVLALVSKSLRSSLASRDMIIAVELAQEGVELIRNVRDNDFAAGNNGFSGFSSNKYCYRDFNDTLVGLDCDPVMGSPSRYYLQYRNGLYEHVSPPSAERFSRFIYVDYNSSRNDALVRSFVYWGEASPPPATGDPASCLPVDSCVFTELYLTSWK